MILSDKDLARCAAISGKSLGKVKPIVDAVADATGIPARMIYGQFGPRAVTEARQLVYYLAHERGISLSDIGRFMHRDHSTVASGIKAEKARRAQLEDIPVKEGMQG